jgi:hypothetical protein
MQNFNIKIIKDLRTSIDHYLMKQVYIFLEINKVYFDQEH